MVIKDNVTEGMRRLNKQAPWIAINAINKTAFDIRAETITRLPQWVKLTRPFLQQSVVVDKANPGKPAASVGFHKRAYFVNLLEFGGIKTPKDGKALAIKVDAKPGQRPSRVINRKNVFSAAIGSVGGIWKMIGRKANRALDLLFYYTSKATYRNKFFRFHETAKSVAQQKLKANTDAALQKTLNDIVSRTRGK